MEVHRYRVSLLFFAKLNFNFHMSWYYYTFHFIRPPTHPSTRNSSWTSTSTYALTATSIKNLTISSSLTWACCSEYKMASEIFTKHLDKTQKKTLSLYSYENLFSSFCMNECIKHKTITLYLWRIWLILSNIIKLRHMCTNME